MNSAIAVIRELSGQQNTLTIPRLYVELMGSLDGALFLNQLVFWSDKGKRPDGYIYKSRQEWTDETVLSDYAIRKATQQLQDLGILETRLIKAGGAPTLHYRLNLEALYAALVSLISTNGFVEIDKSICRKRQNHGFVEIDKSITDKYHKRDADDGIPPLQITFLDPIPPPPRAPPDPVRAGPRACPSHLPASKLLAALLREMRLRGEIPADMEYAQAISLDDGVLTVALPTAMAIDLMQSDRQRPRVLSSLAHVTDGSPPELKFVVVGAGHPELVEGPCPERTPT